MASSNHPTPSQLGNALLIAKFELQKMFINPRGVVALLAFALTWTLILMYPVRGASTLLLDDTFKAFIASLVGESSLDQLFSWPVAELAVFWCTALYIFPMFSIFIAADQFASDRSRGLFRFLTLRVSRDSLFFGRFAGAILSQLILVVLAVGSTIILAISRDSTLLIVAMMDGALITLNLTLILLPFTALMAVLSLRADTARQATIQAIVFWALTSIFMLMIKLYVPELTLLEWLLPGAQLASMVNTYGIDTLTLSPIPLLQATALLVFGRIYMLRTAL